MRDASITSFPTPSPGIHAIRYLAIGRRLYRQARRSQPCSGERTRLACCIRRLAECNLPLENEPGGRDFTTRAGKRCKEKFAKASRLRQHASRVRSPDYAAPRSRDATSFSAPPVTINSCAAGLSGGKGNDFPP